MLGREALQIVLPSWCVACDRQLPWRMRTASVCSDCWAALPKISGPRCDSCALPWDGPGDSAGFRCNRCVTDPLPVGWCDAWGHYRDSLERVLHAFKFERHDFLDEPLGALVAETVLAHEDRAFDAIVPVPMHPTRVRRRGYNQAELLSHALSRSIGLDCEPSLLERRIERAPQSTLPRRERAANVRQAFVAAARAKGRSILIVDDICTTGETIRACAIALLAQGAERVCAVAVAKAS